MYAKGASKPEFDLACMLTVVALGEKSWAGEWRIDEQHKVILLHGIEKSNRGLKADGQLTLEELQNFITVEQNREFVKHLPNSCHGLLDKDLLEEAFKTFDYDHSGAIDTEEWGGFLDSLEYLRIQFLLVVAFLQFRAFFGRGQDWCNGRGVLGEQVTEEELMAAAGELLDEDPAPEKVPLKQLRENSHQDDSARSLGSEPSDLSKKTGISQKIKAGMSGKIPWWSRTKKSFRKKDMPHFQVGLDDDRSGWLLLPKGWWEDLVYYSANVHSLHGIFSCDPDHPLSKIERLMMELAAIGIGWHTCLLHRDWVVKGQAPIDLLKHERWFSLVVVTIPKLIAYYVLFNLFTCPCRGVVDTSSASVGEIRHARICGCAGNLIGYFIMAVGLLYFLVYVFYRADFSNDAHSWATYSTLIYSIIYSYIFSWIMILILPFNPLMALGEPDPDKSNDLYLYLQLGSWRIEKQRFQARCLMAAEAMSEAGHGFEHEVRQLSGMGRTCTLRTCVVPPMSACVVS